MCRFLLVYHLQDVLLNPIITATIIPLSRIHGHAFGKAQARYRHLSSATALLVRRRHEHLQLVIHTVNRYAQHHAAVKRYVIWAREISSTEFNFTFSSLTDAAYSTLFWLRMDDVVRMVHAVGWLAMRTHTNRYGCDLLLITRVFLRRVCSRALVEMKENFSWSIRIRTVWKFLGGGVEFLWKAVASYDWGSVRSCYGKSCWGVWLRY